MGLAVLAQVRRYSTDRYSDSVTNHSADERLFHDDTIEICICGAYCLQGAVLAKMVDGGRIDGLRHDDQTDRKTQRGSQQNRKARSGAEHPVDSRLPAELVRRVHI